MNEYLLNDPSWNGPLIVAVQRAITETFSKSDWNEVGHLTGLHAYITGHKRLLRSLGSVRKEMSQTPHGTGQ